jgi:hypothetical protein
MSSNIIAPLDPARILTVLSDYFKEWYPEFAAEYERQNGYEPKWFIQPEKWETMATFRHWNENELPHVVVACAGFMEPSMKHGSGQMDARLLVTFVIVCGSNERISSHELAMGYGQIIGWIGDEYAPPAEDSFVREMILVDLDYTDIEPNTSVASAAVSFEVDVYGYMSGTGGPPPIINDPRDDPYGEPPEDYNSPPNTTELEVIKVTEIN